MATTLTGATVRALDLIALKRGEGSPFALLFLYYFCLVALTIAAKAARDACFLSQYDKSLLPLMFVASAASVAVAVAVYSGLAKRLGDRTTLHLTNGLFAGSLVVIQPVIAGILIPVSYVWIEVITVITMLQFWLLAPALFDPRRAKRLYGPIAGGGSIGAIAMGLTLKPFVSAFGSRALLYLVAGLIVVSWILAQMAFKFAREPARERKPVNAKQSAGPISEYLLCIGAAISMAAIVTTVVDYQFKILAGRAFPDEASLVSFFGSFYAATGMSTLLAQFAITSLILSRFGVLAGLLVLPILQNVGVAAILLNPGLASAILAKFSDQTFKFTLTNASMELLWLPVPTSQRLAFKPLISGAVKSASEGAAGIIVYVLAPLLALQQLSLLTLAALVLWIATVLRLRTLYVREVSQAVDSGRISFSELRVDIRDPVMVSTIDRALLQGTESQGLFALHLIEGLPLKPWAQSLQGLLATGPLPIRKRILELAGDSPDVLPESAIAAAIAAGDEASADALMVAGRRKLSIFMPHLRNLLASPNPELRAAAALALKLARPEESRDADAVLATMLSSQDSASVAAAIDRVAPDTAILPTTRLVELIGSPHRGVRSAALQALGQRADPTAVLPIVRSIQGRMDVAPIRSLLRLFPGDLVARRLASEFARKDGDLSRESALLRILADYPGDYSRVSLLKAVNPHDLDLCEPAAEGLLRSARAVPAGEQVTSAVSGKIGDLTERAYFLTRVLMLLPRDDGTFLLRDYYDNQFKRSLRVILRLSATRIPSIPIETCIQIIQVRDSRRLPFVLELLDGLLNPRERSIVYPLIETTSIEERDCAGAEHFTALPASLEPLLLDNINNGRPWIAAVSFDYLSRWKSGSVRFIDSSRLTANGLIRETAERLSPATAECLEVTPKMYTTLEKAVFLKSVSLFQNIPAERVADIAQVAVETSVPTNTVLFREGDRGDSLYIVLDGCIRVHKGGRDLASLTQGGCLGEMAVLDQEPRSADATAVEDSTLLRIDQEAFYEVLSQNQELVHGIMRLLTSRLRAAGERLATASSSQDSGVAQASTLKKQ